MPILLEITAPYLHGGWSKREPLLEGKGESLRKKLLGINNKNKTKNKTEIATGRKRIHTRE